MRRSTTLLTAAAVLALSAATAPAALADSHTGTPCSGFYSGILGGSGLSNGLVAGGPYTVVADTGPVTEVWLTCTLYDGDGSYLDSYTQEAPGDTVALVHDGLPPGAVTVCTTLSWSTSMVSRHDDDFSCEAVVYGV